MFVEILTRKNPDQTEITVLLPNLDGPVYRAETLIWTHILSEEEVAIVAQYLRKRWQDPE